MKGVLFIIGNIIVASLQSVLLSSWLNGINVFLIVALSFSIVMSLYTSLFFAKGRRFVASLVELKREILIINFVSACNWIFYFFAIKFLNPSAVVTITQCMPAVFISFFMIARGKKPSSTTILFHSLILLCIVFLVNSYISQSSSSGNNTILGVIISLLCAITVAMTISVSRVFSENKIPSYVVLSLRFPLLILISWSLVPRSSLLEISKEQVYIILFVALVGLALANYFLQKGVEFATPLIVSTTLTLSPAVVLFFDKIYRHNHTMDLRSWVVLLIVTLSLACIYFNARRKDA
ncbi:MULTISPECIES: DMT family transporter [unclassified Pantoea]|uniref:DMT family transporter n=1 Tax=unclassified Pantoea TaxID=2630326 RepID=UPI0025540E58|nr:MULTISPECIES: DMT family transporter [unclassified Pantoea]